MRSGRWLALTVIVACAVVGFIAYDAGLARGALQAGAAANAAVPAYPYYGWGWHRPWGFGFGFPLLLIVLFWVAISRAVFCGGPWRRRWYYYDRDLPSSFDEMHRRAHDRMEHKPTQF